MNWAILIHISHPTAIPPILPYTWAHIYPMLSPHHVYHTNSAWHAALTWPFPRCSRQKNSFRGHPIPMSSPVTTRLCRSLYEHKLHYGYRAFPNFPKCKSTYILYRNISYSCKIRLHCWSRKSWCARGHFFHLITTVMCSNAAGLPCTLRSNFEMRKGWRDN